MYFIRRETIFMDNGKEISCELHAEEKTPGESGFSYVTCDAFPDMVWYTDFDGKKAYPSEEPDCYTEEFNVAEKLATALTTDYQGWTDFAVDKIKRSYRNGFKESPLRKTQKRHLEENYEDFDAACIQASSIVKNLLRKYDFETIQMAFQKALKI